MKPITVLICLLLLAIGSFVFKFGWEHVVSVRERNEFKRANGIYLILVKSIDQYVDDHEHCPDTLEVLNLGHMGIKLDGFHYRTSNGVCVISFQGKFVKFYHSLNYSLNDS